MENEIPHELVVIFQETLKRSDFKLSLDDFLNKLPGMDSLKLIHLVFGIEKKFSLKFSTREVVNFKQVRDIVEAIKSRKAE